MKQTIQLFLLAVLLYASGVLVKPVWAQDAPASAVITVTEETPDEAVLSHAYPNPFNPRTTFSLTVRQRQDVKVEVFNMLGRRVRLLYDGPLEADEKRTFTFKAGALPSGIYLYRATGKTFNMTRQVTLIK